MKAIRNIISNRWSRMTIMLTAIILMIATNASGQQQKYKIGLFIPHEHGTFWNFVLDVSYAACHDLGIELQVYHAKGNREKMRQQIEEAASGSDKVDALMFQSFKQAGESFLQVAETARVPAFLFNAGVDHQKTGAPREKYKYWIGEILPDDEGAGFDLANYLIDTAVRAKKQGTNGKIQMVAMNGVLSDGAAIERGKGLRRAIQSRNDVNLLRVVPADWGSELSRQKFHALMRRFPQTTVVWAANDDMALGVVKGIRERKLKAGRDVIVGGIDWQIDALKSIKAEELTLSIGGHFLEASWVIVMLYDYFHGIDFAQEGLVMKSKMNLLTKDNLDTYFKHLGTGDWEKVNFSKFSKKLHPELKRYNFGLEAILAQF